MVLSGDREISEYLGAARAEREEVQGSNGIERSTRVILWYLLLKVVQVS